MLFLEGFANPRVIEPFDRNWMRPDGSWTMASGEASRAQDPQEHLFCGFYASWICSVAGLVLLRGLPYRVCRKTNKTK